MKRLYKNNSRKTLVIVSAFSALLLTSCTNNYTFTSNLNKENIKEYFGPAQVVIYNHEGELPQPYTYTGLVEGQDCQIKPHHAQPDKKVARTEARRLAYKRGANAVIFTSCAMLFDKGSDKKANVNNSKKDNIINSNDTDNNDVLQCHALMVCYGKSYSTINK